jgi:phosphonate transport system substrate-binding protein
VKSQNPEPPPVDELKGLKEYLVRLSGNQKLADGYVDVDPKDMVADTPKDQKKWADVSGELTFTVVGTEDPAQAAQEWKDFMTALEKATGKKVKYLDSVQTIEEQLAAVREGKLHVTAFNTGAVSTAVNTAGFVPLFAPADKDGKYSYQMMILVRQSAPEQKPEDLKGKKVGFVALSSNSGAKAPMVELKKLNMLPGRDYKYSITGDHILSVKELIAGKFDAVCVASDLLTRAEAEGKVDKKEYRAIYTSDPFPPLCFGIPHNLPPEMQAKVKTAFTNFQFADTSVGKRYGPQGKVKFAPVNYEKDWEYVRKIDDTLTHLLDGN